MEDGDVDVLLTDMLNINLTLLVEHLILHHSEGDVAPEIVETNSNDFLWPGMVK